MRVLGLRARKHAERAVPAQDESMFTSVQRVRAATRRTQSDMMRT